MSRQHLIVNAATGEETLVPFTAEEEIAWASNEAAALAAQQERLTSASAFAAQHDADVQAVLGIVTDPAAQAALARILARALGQAG